MTHRNAVRTAARTVAAAAMALAAVAAPALHGAAQIPTGDVEPLCTATGPLTVSVSGTTVSYTWQAKGSCGGAPLVISVSGQSQQSGPCQLLYGFDLNGTLDFVDPTTGQPLPNQQGTDVFAFFVPASPLPTTSPVATPVQVFYWGFPTTHAGHSGFGVFVHNVALANNGCPVPGTSQAKLVWSMLGTTD